MKYDISHALIELAPNTKWVLNGTSHEGLDWQDLSIKRPTRAAIDKWIADKEKEEPIRLLRIERDKRIAKTDWWASSDRTMTPEQAVYRKALRDITKTATPKLLPNGDLDLTSVVWPEI